MKVNLTDFEAYELVQINDPDTVILITHGDSKTYSSTRPGRSCSGLQDPVVTFAMADEDAFVYCDRPICKIVKAHCMFQCKQGLVIYVYCNVHVL